MCHASWNFRGHVWKPDNATERTIAVSYTPEQAQDCPQKIDWGYILVELEGGVSEAQSTLTNRTNEQRLNASKVDQLTLEKSKEIEQ